MKVNTLDIYVNIQVVIYTQYHGAAPPAKYLPITTVFCWKSTPNKFLTSSYQLRKKESNAIGVIVTWNSTCQLILIS